MSSTNARKKETDGGKGREGWRREREGGREGDAKKRFPGHCLKHNSVPLTVSLKLYFLPRLHYVPNASPTPCSALTTRLPSPFPHTHPHEVPAAPHRHTFIIHPYTSLHIPTKPPHTCSLVRMLKRPQLYASTHTSPHIISICLTPYHSGRLPHALFPPRPRSSGTAEWTTYTREVTPLPCQGSNPLLCRLPGTYFVIFRERKLKNIVKVCVFTMFVWLLV